MLITSQNKTRNPQGTRLGSPLVAAALCAVLASIIASWIWNGGSITIFEIFIWRPLAFLAILMGASFWWSKRNALSLAQALNELLAFVPCALIFAVLVGFIPVWKLDYTSLPMGLGDIGLYFVSLGFAPRLAGPDILLRGFAWGIAIFAAIRTYKNGKDIGASLLDLLLVWISSSVALLLPWLVFWMLGPLCGSELPGNGQEIIRVFSQFTLNSYWNNLQIVRWFLGFGEQLSHSMVLFLSAVFYLLEVAYLVVALRDKLFSSLKKIGWENVTSVGLAAAAGLMAGWSRTPWVWGDIVVWLIFFTILFASLILLQARSEDAEDIFNFSLAGGLVGSFILGWPVAAAFVAFICAVLLSPREQEISDYKIFFSRALIFIVALGLGLAFVRRGDVVNQHMLYIALASLLLCLPAFLPSRIDWLKRGVIWLGAGLAATLLLQSLVPVAISILAVAVWHAIQKIRPNLLVFLQPSIYLCAFFVLILAVWLPRLLNPRLLGY